MLCFAMTNVIFFIPCSNVSFCDNSLSKFYTLIRVVPRQNPVWPVIREYCDGNTILKVVYDDTVSASTILYFTSDKKGAFHNQPQPANRTPMENHKWTGYKNSVSLF